MNVLIVCTGNTCRSPMAEGILKSIDKDGMLNVLSAGVFAYEGEEASPNAIMALDEMGIDIKDHTSHGVNESVLEEADIILAMTRSHKMSLVSMYPQVADKTYTLCEFAGMEGDIADPYGQSLDVYKSCAKMIEEALYKVYEKMRDGER